MKRDIVCMKSEHNLDHQEGLPDYWGIETLSCIFRFLPFEFAHQEGLPDYWGIETINSSQLNLVHLQPLSGRITRLLGY